MDGDSENPNVEHQGSEECSGQTPLTTENLATHNNSDTYDSHDSGSSNDHQNSEKADPTLGYIGAQFGNDTTTDENRQHDDTPMQRWQSSSDDRPVFWPSKEKDENEQGSSTK